MDAHLIQSSPRAIVRDNMPIPASPYLQERLQAQRGHAKRSRRSDFGPRSRNIDHDIFMAEAEADGAVKRFSNTPSDPSSTRGTPTKNGASRDTNLPKNLGAREMDKYLDKLSKDNFDLKMNLHHCRERMERMREQYDALLSRNEEAERAAERAEQLARERSALLDINEELVKELEKRDEAVKEAVGIICDLEEKLESLKRQASILTNPSSLSNSKDRSQNLLATTRTSYPSLVPTETGASRILTPESHATPRKRVPSFMSDKKPSTNALRSVYLEPTARLHVVKSYASLISQRDDFPDLDGMDSPRLSVLSESSFPSIYSPKRPSDVQEEDASGVDNQPVDGHQPSTSSYDRYKSDNSRITEWVASRAPAHQPPPRSRIRQSSAEIQYQSLDDHLVHEVLQEPFDETKATPVDIAGLKKSPPRLSAQGYGEGSLPPTPESVSTRLLRESRSTLADSRSTTASSRQYIFKKEDQNYFGDTAKSDVRALDHQDSANVTSSQKYSSIISSLNNQVEAAMDNDHADASSSTVRDIGEGYGIHPDGGSMITGTPSRFQTRHVSPPANNLLFDGDGIEEIVRPKDKRRSTGVGRSSLHVDNTPPRARLPRAETSPSLLTPTQDGRNTNKESSNANGTGQTERSSHGECILVDRFGQKSSLKDITNPLAPNAAGMRASFAQKTQKFFRRKSDVRGDLSLSTRATHAAAPAITQTSPRRPTTALPSEKSSNRVGASNLMDGVKHNRRPSSQDSDLALVAANQAIASRRLSHQPDAHHAGRGPLSPSGSNSRGFFKRAGSVRR